jgi:alpha-beta hydrolase superfamily lysophospholipase
VRGRIAYIGQLEDDLQDFIASVPGPSPKILVGFSSGGGFTLRFAGSARQGLFDGYLLLSPFLSPDSAVSRKNSGGWVGVGIPRIIALLLLNKMGVTALNDLPVLAFALSERDRKYLTPEYSFTLWSNFRPHDDYRKDIREAKKPMALVAGSADEAFRTDMFAQEFETAGKNVPVTLVPGLSHVGLILDPRGIQAIVKALELLPPK